MSTVPETPLCRSCVGKLEFEALPALRTFVLLLKKPWILAKQTYIHIYIYIYIIYTYINNIHIYDMYIIAHIYIYIELLLKPCRSSNRAIGRPRPRL